MSGTNSWRSKTKNKTLELSYLESMTASLIEHASRSKEFAGELKNLCEHIEGEYYEGIKSKEIEGEKWLAPENDEIAVSRAVWLISRINEGVMAGTDTSAQRLLEWKSIYPYESPKQVVVGIAATTIPGITVGKISRRKTMTLIVNNNLDQDSLTKLAQLAVSASQGIVSRSLEQVGGEASRIDPDLSMWMYEDREIKFYQANSGEMKKIKKELDRAGVATEMISSDDHPAALALSPAVNLSAIGNNWKLKSL